MVNRWMGVGLFGAGLMMGVAMSGLQQDPVVSAQAGWQCRSWMLGDRTAAASDRVSTDAADVVGPWLGTAARVEIATTGLEIAGRYTLVACKS